ncbi:MAG: DUF3536 domain-containing protein [Chloroflexi bacterium]|nr:DUF3536 domain-containing protein [Chloroflexota bacterium]
MLKYICIHGHFYQPPRENPWLESIQLQDSAYPYHDWNQRITAECYAPNVVSRLLDPQGRIVQLVNNYAKMSFNFGPTLLTWLEVNAPEVYQAIIRADKESMMRFSGHGSALAQVYNHLIMPLANRRDKHTQVLWGIRDFEHRFGRKPEGMWLPETAVDLETLEALAQLGIRFTILAPHQAQRVRPLESGQWQDVSEERVDPTMPYILLLPSGKSIAIFFYNASISRAIAFQGLLSSGEAFAQRLLGAFSETPSRPQLVHIATDGETYGHHHRFGDMALTYASHYIQSRGLAHFTNYGEYLEKHPPTHQVEIVENTSWSCSHGIERWRSDCGCHMGTNPHWNQAWRAPLREALNWLRDALIPQYEAKGGILLKDPWVARDDYVSVLLHRSPDNMEEFFNQHARRSLAEEEKVIALKLLELQRHSMLMFASCGWFFDDISGLEATQIMHYAGRAVQLAQEVFGDEMESRFLQLLERAPSNIKDFRNGRHIFERFIKPAMIDLPRVGAHYAINSLFQNYPQHARVYCYSAERRDYRQLQIGAMKLATGQVRITSQITREGAELSFGILHFGDHNFSGGVQRYRGKDSYGTMVQEVTDFFMAADIPEVIRLLARHFRGVTYSIKSLFRDEQRRILNQVMDSTLTEADDSFRLLYKHHYPLMRFINDLGAPIPKALRSAAEFILNTDLRQALSTIALNPERVRSLVHEAEAWKVELDTQGLSYLFRQNLEGLMASFASQPDDLSQLQNLVEAVMLASTMPFEVYLWRVQNIYYEMLPTTYLDYRRRADEGDELAQGWVALFTSLGEQLSISVP